MKIVYIYDVKAKDKRTFNRVKRMFYYNLNKLMLKNLSWRTKSVLVIDPEYERLLDDFFQDFKSNIEVYKIRAKLIEELF
jgi:hypothetical protein